LNRDLPVVLEDSFRRNVWGLDLAYAIDIRLLSGASMQAGRAAAPAAPEALATEPGDVLVYHKDGLGSVRAITDVAGNVIETYETDEFGVVTGYSGTIEQPFGYTGEIRDAETFLVYLRARYYDPKVARFISRDTELGDLTHPLSMNRYTYALDNPLSYVDSSGQTNTYYVPKVTAFLTNCRGPSPDRLQQDMRRIGYLSLHCLVLVSTERHSSSHFQANRGRLCHARDGSMAVAFATIVPMSRASPCFVRGGFLAPFCCCCWV
jgi:RHS repeat-associated protein